MGSRIRLSSVSSVTQSCPTLCDPMNHQHARPPCLSTPGVHPNSCPSSWWYHPTISSSVVPFSSCPQSLPASGSFPMSQLFASGDQNIGISASASVLPMNTQDWSPLGWTGWISLQSQESSPTPQFKSISSSALSFVYSVHGFKLWVHVSDNVSVGRDSMPWCTYLLGLPGQSITHWVA